MATAEAALAAIPSPSPSFEDSDDELTTMTTGLRAMTVDGEPDYRARMAAYAELKAQTFTGWEEIDAKERSKPKESQAKLQATSNSAASKTGDQGAEYQGLGPAPKVAWDIPRHPSKYLLKDTDSVTHFPPKEVMLEAPQIRRALRDFDIALGEETVAAWIELEREQEELERKYAASKAEGKASGKDMSWFLREAEKVRDDPERDNSFEAWKRIVPRESWEAIFETWSAKQDEKERQAAQTEAEAANRTKGKGKVKK